MTLSLTSCDFLPITFSFSHDHSQNSDSSSAMQSTNSGSTNSSIHDNSSSNTSSSSAEEGETINLQIYAFNDLHGNVIDSGTGLGISKTTSLLKTHANKDNVLYISQGDMWQGSAESNLTHGNLVTDWMNQNNFVSMTLGNHEFDWGEDPIKDNASKANFPFLACNIYNVNTNQRVDYCEASTIVEKNGAKIGVIGAIGDCYSSISASRVRNVEFLVGEQLTNLIKEESRKLKQQGCDMIIYSVHDDYSNYDVSLSNGYVDLVFEGHSHQNYVRVDDYGVYHIQGGGYNSTIPYVNFDLDTGSNTINVKQARALDTNDYYSSVDNDADTETLFAKYDSIIGHVHDPIGYNAYDRNSYFLRQLIADLYLQAGLEKWSASYNIFLAGGYISCRSPYYLPAGPVSYADIYSLFPFDNDIELCTVSGYYLSSKFVNTENENYFISYTSYGESNRESINNYDTYYLISDTYSSDYAPNNLTVVAKYRTDGYYARDLLKDYIAAGHLA